MYFNGSNPGHLVAGLIYTRDKDTYCNNAPCGQVPPCDCLGCDNCEPVPLHPGLGACDNYLGGSTHLLFHDGKWWGQAQGNVAGTTAGSIYNASDGEVATDLWSNYAFCNICSHPNHFYHCKQVGSRVNELYIDQVATGILSSTLFGVELPGVFAGVIGHIRAIWDDNDTLVIVRKDDSTPQPDRHVIWTYDPVNGLVDKTGNLNLVVWYGTGRGLPPIVYNHRWDNVGFSAFGVPLR
jgi:hypothetical protein